MVNAQNKKSDANYAPIVTVYYDLEPKQLKIKYEMDKFLFEYSDDFEEALTKGDFTLLVDLYKQAVSEAAGVKLGDKHTGSEKRIKFEDIA